MDAGDLQRLRHDLRAPLVNIAGFSSELLEASRQLVSLTESYAEQLPSEFRQQATAILNQDVVACAGFIETAVSLLDSRIDDITQLEVED